MMYMGFFLTARFFREKILKRLARLRDFVADIRSENGSLIFPSSIEGNVDITGKGLRHFLGQRVENVRLPIVEERRNDRAGRKQRMSLKVIINFVLLFPIPLLLLLLLLLLIASNLV